MIFYYRVYGVKKLIRQTASQPTALALLGCAFGQLFNILSNLCIFLSGTDQKLVLDEILFFLRND